MLQNSPSKNGRYLLYLFPGNRLSWDHDGIGWDGNDILTKHRRAGKSVIIETSEALFAYLDNPTSRGSVTITLNDKHSAVVTDNDVQVGCQIFTHDRVLALAKEVESRQ